MYIYIFPVAPTQSSRGSVECTWLCDHSVPRAGWEMESPLAFCLGWSCEGLLGATLLAPPSSSPQQGTGFLVESTHLQSAGDLGRWEIHTSAFCFVLRVEIFKVCKKIVLLMQESKKVADVTNKTIPMHLPGNTDFFFLLQRNKLGPIWALGSLSRCFLDLLAHGAVMRSSGNASQL